MKKKLTVFLAVEAIFCVILALLSKALPSFFGGLISFPFRPIGLGLRALSLSGGAGNAAAIGLYIAFCLIPVGFLLSRKTWSWEDSLLIILSAVLFPAMYLMVNPQLQGQWLGQMQSMMGTEIMGAVLWSILAGYGILKLLRRCHGAGESQLMDYLKWLLAAFAAFYILGAFGTGLEELITSLESVTMQNTAGGLGTTYFFLVLQYILNILPNLLFCTLLLSAVELLEEMIREPYSESVIALAEHLGIRCGRILGITVVSSLSFNLLQLICMRNLRVVNAMVRLPLDVVALVIGLLLISRFIRSHRQLKEENDFFI